MSRAGFDEYGDYDNWSYIMWRGQVTSSIRGKRGQTFLRDLLIALDEIPTKRLIKDDLIRDGEVCAIGSLGIKRGVELNDLDPYDYDTLAEKFGITQQLIREIEWLNDEQNKRATPEERWQYIRDWVVKNIK